MLAIVARSFSIKSETFIRGHVRDIAPGRTVLITQEADAPDGLNANAVLGLVPSWQPSEKFLIRLFQKLAHRFRQTVHPSLRRSDRQRATEFLYAHRPRALLVEFLDHATQFVDLSTKMGIPLYAFAHGYDVARALASKRQRRHLQRLFQNARGIIVASEFTKGRVSELGCPINKIHVAYPGIDPTLFRPSTRVPGAVLAVGRLVEVKAPHLMIRSFCKAAADRQDIRLDVVGEGPLFSECVAEVARHEMEARVKFHGSLSQEAVSELFARTSLFIQHSITTSGSEAEGFGIVALEAMASEVPIVATRHGGFQESVLNGKTGVLVEEHDVDGMAAAIGQLLDNPDRAQAMGAIGRQRVLTYFTHVRSASRLRAVMGLECADGNQAN